MEQLALYKYTLNKSEGGYGTAEGLLLKCSRVYTLVVPLETSPRGFLDAPRQLELGSTEQYWIRIHYLLFQFRPSTASKVGCAYQLCCVPKLTRKTGDRYFVSLDATAQIIMKYKFVTF